LENTRNRGSRAALLETLKARGLLELVGTVGAEGLKALLSVGSIMAMN
jgi:hypothetical protein